MSVRQRLISLFLILLISFSCYSRETITGTIDEQGRIWFAEKDIEILNDELRRINDGVNTTKPTITFSGDATGSGTTTITITLEDDSVGADEIEDGTVGADELASTTVTPGSYTNTDLTVDADGRITAASNGALGTSASNVLFCWYGMVSAVGLVYEDSESDFSINNGSVYFKITTNTAATFFVSKFKKISDIDTVTVYGYVKSGGGNEAVTLTADIGGQSASGSTTGTHNVLQWVTATVDVSGLTNNTVYDVAIKGQASSVSSYDFYIYSMIGIGS